jgi:hypothetical protein
MILLDPSHIKRSGTPVYSSWFLPSEEEAGLMYDNLIASSVGDFVLSDYYWTSTETNATEVRLMGTDDGGSYPTQKSNTFNIRACRTITIRESAYSYELRDTGESGGLIFYRSRSGSISTYYEAYPTDLAAAVWSNVNNSSIGTTGSDIGDGYQNSLDIVAQAGHTASAANSCLNL